MLYNCLIKSFVINVKELYAYSFNLTMLGILIVRVSSRMRPGKVYKSPKAIQIKSNGGAATIEPQLLESKGLGFEHCLGCSLERVLGKIETWEGL